MTYLADTDEVFDLDVSVTRNRSPEPCRSYRSARTGEVGRIGAMMEEKVRDGRLDRFLDIL